MYKGPETTKSTFDFLNYWNLLPFKEFVFSKFSEEKKSFAFPSTTYYK